MWRAQNEQVRSAAVAEPLALHLEHELERMQLRLRDTVEPYEVSTEELKASDEELQAMNEELRSATEELETSGEELQSGAGAQHCGAARRLRAAQQLGSGRRQRFHRAPATA